MRHALSAAILHFFLPALAFGLLAQAPADRSLIAVPLAAAFVTLAGMAAGYGFYRLVPWFRQIPRPAFGVMVLSAAFGNVTYLGLPVIIETLGSEYGYIAIIYDLLATTPVLLTIGIFVVARYGEGEKDLSVRRSIIRVLRLPPIWGVAAGLIVNLGGMTVPAVIMDAAALMGKAVIPVMIFTVGLALDFRDLRRLPVAAPALLLKLVLAPALAFWAGAQLGMTGDTLRALVLEGAMPVMVLSLVIADELRLDVPLAAACITVSTVASFFTAPLMMRVLF